VSCGLLTAGSAITAEHSSSEVRTKNTYFMA